ncbi:1,4-beta-xylanase [Microbacterium lushaniae]|nr:1,4-beta-xylanase [Microbacterium lushaniae]KAA9159003.1 1,4-beta-xylanase [Microbacterium lushaniae]
MPEFAHRRTDARLRLVDRHGTPLAGATVTVAQTRHAFGFGNIGFDFIDPIAGPPPHEIAEATDRGGAGPQDPAAPAELDVLADAYLSLFNAVTLPFYWRLFEPVRGVTDAERLRRTARWFRDRGVTVKGHPLVWHTLAPTWLLDLDDRAVEDAVRERIRTVVAGFAGTVDVWDAINEAVILPAFTAEDNALTRLAQRHGRLGMVRMAFEEARAAGPDARLVLNDFDLSPAYGRIIDESLDAGVPIDAIGLQTHMHQGFRGEDEIGEVLDRFARFGLPLQLTETTLVSGDLMPPHIVDLNDYVVEDWPSTPEGEERQADEIVRHYRTAFAHPAVESVTYWGLTDAGAWLGAPAGLLRVDGSRKPAFDALHDLVRGQWWTPPASAAADADAVVAVRGFAGTYRVRTDAAEADVELPAGPFAGDVVLSGER